MADIMLSKRHGNLHKLGYEKNCKLNVIQVWTTVPNTEHFLR